MLSTTQIKGDKIHPPGFFYVSYHWGILKVQITWNHLSIKKLIATSKLFWSNCALLTSWKVSISASRRVTATIWFSTNPFSCKRSKNRNGILFPTVPTVGKKWTSNREKLFEFLRSLEQFIRTVKGQTNFWNKLQDAF